jgi:hypothetical protein
MHELLQEGNGLGQCLEPARQVYEQLRDRIASGGIPPATNGEPGRAPRSDPLVSCCTTRTPTARLGANTVRTMGRRAASRSRWLVAA